MVEHLVGVRGGGGRCIHPRRRAGFRRFLMDVSSVPHGYTAIGIKWLSGFIMMAELNFIERPGNSISPVIYLRRVHFFNAPFRGDFRRILFGFFFFFWMEASF